MRRSIRDLATQVPIFGDREPLGAAFQELGSGRPALVLVGRNVHVLLPTDAVGHSPTRRLVDLPLTAVQPISADTRLPQALAACNDRDLVVVDLGASTMGIATRAAIVEAILSSVSATGADAAQATATVLDVLDHSPEGIVVLDSARRVHAVNPAGRRVMDALAAPSCGEVLEHLAGVSVDALIEDGRRGTPRDIPVSEPARRVFTVRTLQRSDPESGPQDLVLILRDVTHLRHRQAREADQERMALLGHLASGIVHDLNNMLTVIMGETSLLLAADGTRDDKTIRGLSAIAEAGAGSSRLLRQLLAFARRELAVPVALDLGTVVRGIEDILRRLAGAATTLRVEVSDPLDGVVADPVQIERILTNLVANARRAMPSGGQIRIVVANEPACSLLPRGGAQPTRAAVRLTVEDNGSGMDAETAARAFEPYFTTDCGVGTGLGLSTVRATVTQLGGHVSLRTQPGAGTRFDVLLPSQVGVIDARSIATGPRESRGKLSGRLLVVEEHPQVAVFLEEALKLGGYSVDVAKNADECDARVAQRGEPDLLILDINTGAGSGVELARQLRDRLPKLRVLLMSGVADDGLLRESKHPLVEYIAKPFTADELLGRVAAIVGDALE